MASGPTDSNPARDWQENLNEKEPKVHRAAEFTVGLLNNQPMGFYGPATLRWHGSGGHAVADHMDAIERMQADYRSQRLTTGPHPMKLLREHLPGLWKANEVGTARHGTEIAIGGAVI